MRRKVVFIILISLLILGIGGIILANQKSPETSKNLLEYVIYHQKKWECLNEQGSSDVISTSSGLFIDIMQPKKIKNYYLGIPVLKSSCPEGLTAGKEI